MVFVPPPLSLSLARSLARSLSLSLPGPKYRQNNYTTSTEQLHKACKRNQIYTFSTFRANMLLRWPGVHFDFCVLGTHGGVVLIPSASCQVWPYYHSTRGAAGILPVQRLSAGEGPIQLTSSCDGLMKSVFCRLHTPLGLVLRTSSRSKRGPQRGNT